MSIRDELTIEEIERRNAETKRKRVLGRGVRDLQKPSTPSPQWVESSSPRRWKMYAHKSDCGFKHIGHRRYVELHLLSDLIVPVDVIENPNGDYYGWIEKGKNEPTMIWGDYFQFSMCFPYGVDIEVVEGKGEVVRLDVVERVESSPEMPVLKPSKSVERFSASKGSTVKGLLLTVGLPPSVNHTYANTPNGRVLYKSVRKYKRETKALITNAALYLKFAYNGERLSLTLRLFFPNKRRSDISNRVKCIEDCLASALGFDDKMVDVLHVERAGISTDNPRCEITLLKLESE